MLQELTSRFSIGFLTRAYSDMVPSLASTRTLICKATSSPSLGVLHLLPSLLGSLSPRYLSSRCLIVFSCQNYVLDGASHRPRWQHVRNTKDLSLPTSSSVCLKPGVYRCSPSSPAIGIGDADSPSGGGVVQHERTRHRSPGSLVIWFGTYQFQQACALADVSSSLTIL